MAEQDIQRFGEKLHTLRVSHNLTLKELASALGYKAHGHLSELETGKKIPTVEFVLKVARYFNITTDELLKDEFDFVLSETRQGDSMSLAFIDRDPTWQEVERIRLILSTYQDGTGQWVDKHIGDRTLPGWRDFERAVALALGGEAVESKYVFDVVLSSSDRPDVKYGLSCKMRGELDRVERDGRVTIELSNSAKKFWQRLEHRSIYQTNYRDHPAEVGIEVIEEVRGWHQAESMAAGGKVDITKSFYLALSWNTDGWYQLHQFRLSLPDPATLTWYCPPKRGEMDLAQSQRIKGDDATGTLFEWYGMSGGQLKYYPLAQDAIWASERFQLEPLPEHIEHGILRKAAEYFPDQWQRCSK
jgi:transcriptional regulator with XRE-family HTH domain